MTRIVLVGGLNNGSATDEIREAMLNHANAEDIDTFTFAEGMWLPERLRSAARGVEVFTHSAGALAVANAAATPREIHAFNPPLRRNALGLASWRTLRKTEQMFRDGRRQYGEHGSRAAREYSRASAQEMMHHPYRNMRHLGEIARFSAIRWAIANGDRGCPTDLTYTDRDRYYQPTEAEQTIARAAGISLYVIPGQHDELVLRPKTFLANYHRAVAAGEVATDRFSE